MTGLKIAMYLTQLLSVCPIKVQPSAAYLNLWWITPKAGDLGCSLRAMYLNVFNPWLTSESELLPEIDQIGHCKQTGFPENGVPHTLEFHWILLNFNGYHCRNVHVVNHILDCKFPLESSQGCADFVRFASEKSTSKWGNISTSSTSPFCQWKAAARQHKVSP